VISNPTAQMATFVPDLPGTFVAQLIVNDGIVDSTPATVQIQVVTLQTEVIQNIQSLQKVVAILALGAFKNRSMQNTLQNNLNAVIASIDSGNYSNALGQLQSVLGATSMSSTVITGWSGLSGSLMIRFCCLVPSFTFTSHTDTP